MKLSTNSKTDVFTHVAIILAFVMVLFFGFFFVYLPWSTNHNQTIKIPNLKGLTAEAAEKILEDNDLEFEISDSTFVIGAKPGTVLSNFPQSGLTVKSGRKIYLTMVSYSAPIVKMPSIVGKSIGSAKNQLLSSGLQFGGEEKISALEENTVLKIKVNGKEILPGDAVAKGSKVVLLVGDGYGDLLIDIPDVVGKSKEEAEILITGQELTLGNVLYEASEEVPVGLVIKQNPSAGSGNKIKTGAPITIWISGTEGATPSTNNADKTE
ncbi:MAG: PASTA domain-containing protein [Leadbetterella sp.]